MKSLLWSSLFIFVSIRGFAQSIVIADKATNNVIEDAVVESYNSVFYSNAAGRVQLSNVSDSSLLIISHVNFQSKSIVYVGQDTIFLIGRNNDLTEFILSKPKLIYTKTGRISFNRKYLTVSPKLFSEKDPLKLMQIMPGVGNAQEANSAIYVRGGNYDQVNVLLDGIPIKAQGHALGLFSSINGEIVNDMDLYKSGIPMQLDAGGSGAIRMTTLENVDSFSLSLGVGLLSSQMQLSVPIIKGKWGFYAAGRMSYIDKFVDLGGLYTNFNDINLSTYYKGDKSNFKISFVHIMDSMLFTESIVYFGDFGGIRQSNQGLSANWEYRLSNSKKLTVQAVQSILENRHTMLDYNSLAMGRLGTTTLNAYVNSHTDKLSFTIGARYKYLTNHAEYIGADVSKLQQNIHWAKAYGEVTRYGKEVELTGALAANALVHDAGTNWVLEPRLNLYIPRIRVGVTYDRVLQAAQALTSSVIPLPFDNWILASNRFSPLITDQISGSYAFKLPKKWGQFQIEAFGKNISGAFDFADGTHYIDDKITDENSPIESIQARAAGVEIFYQKLIGRHQTTMSYTFSKVKWQGENINYGEAYNAPFDRPHMFSLNHRIVTKNKKWSVNALFVGQSGRALTLPVVVNPMIFSARNAGRLPFYHRLDLGLNYTSAIKRTKMITDWSINIYNLYNSFNAYHAYYSHSEGSMVTLTIFPVLPTASFSLRF